MNVALALTFWHWRIAHLDVHIDIDGIEQPTPDAEPQQPKLIDWISDLCANRWMARRVKVAA